jgi:hypothetical protein
VNLWSLKTARRVARGVAVGDVAAAVGISHRVDAIGRVGIGDI